MRATRWWGVVCLVLCFAVPSKPLAAQSVVRGRVVSQGTRKPIQGAVVSAEGMTAVADARGWFVIGPVKLGELGLNFHALGYKRRRSAVTVRGDTTDAGTISLDPDPFVLCYCIVTADAHPDRAVGYGRTVIPGAERLQDANPCPCGNEPALPATHGTATSMTDLLTGAAGATTFRPDGSLGTGGAVRLRGRRSPLLSNDPAVEIDGARVTVRAFETGSASGTITPEVSFLDMIPPEDIDSVEVISGMAGSLLDGSSIANGLIRIRTRRPSVSGPVVSLYSQLGTSWDPRHYPDGYYSKQAGSSAQCLPFMEVVQLCQRDTLIVANRFQDPATTVLKSGFRQQVGGRVTGGSNRLGYYASASIANESGLTTTPDIERPYLNQVFGGGPIPAKRLDPNHDRDYAARVNLVARPTRRLELNLSTGLIVDHSRALPRTLGTDPRLYALIGVLFPRDSVVFAGTRATDLYDLVPEREQIRRVAALDAQWIIGGYLTGWARGGYSKDSFDDLVISAPNLGRRQTAEVANTQHNIAAGLAFRRAVGRVGLTVTTGLDQRSRSTRYQATTTVGDLSSQAEGGFEGDWKGAFLQTGVALRRRKAMPTVFLDGAVRVDRASFLGIAGRSAASGRLVGSWVVTEPSLSWLRLRAAAASVARLGSGDEDPRRGLDAAVPPGSNVPSLRPERTNEIEFGTDATLFGGRLQLAATGYRQQTGDVLVPKVGQPSTGFVSYYANEGTVTNTGVEIATSAAVTNGYATRLDLRLTLAANRNRLTQYTGPLSSTGGDERITDNAPLGTIVGIRHAEYRDINGDGILVPGELLSSPATPIGSTMPSRMAGLEAALSLREGRIRLSTRLDYRGGFVARSPLPLTCGILLVCQALNQPTRDNLQEQADQLSVANQNAALVADGSFLRVREVAATWSTRGPVAHWLGASRLTVSLIGRNLATLTGFKDWDPEVQTLGSEFAVGGFIPAPIPRSVAMRIVVDW